MFSGKVSLIRADRDAVSFGAAQAIGAFAIPTQKMWWFVVVGGGRKHHLQQPPALKQGEATAKLHLKDSVYEVATSHISKIGRQSFSPYSKGQGRLCHSLALTKGFFLLPCSEFCLLVRTELRVKTGR